MTKIRVVTKRIGEDANVTSVKNSLETMQKLVGGYIDRVVLPEGIDLWVNDEGLLQELALNIVTLANGEVIHHIVGDVFMAGHNEEGETISLSDHQLEWLRERMCTVGTSEQDGEEYEVVGIVLK